MSSLECSRGLEELVQVGQLARLVGPRTADDAFGVDEKRTASRYVPHAVVVEGHVEAVGRFGVPVGEQRKVEIERLHPGNVRVRRIARDRERLHPGLLQLRSPVTQELELGRSGRGPVEEVEEEEQRAVMKELADARALAWRRPHDRIDR